MDAMKTKQRIHTAHHEASHAVLGRVLTLACAGASIKPDDDSAGHSICGDPWDCVYQWEKRGKVRESDAIWHARIIAFMAGAEGEVELFGSTQGGDGDDRIQIELMAEELSARDPLPWDKREVRLRAMTRMLVRRHRALIKRVANALLRKRTLSGEQLDKLIGRGVDDVKVNAPLLLQMHRGQAHEEQ
jgi:ATP-dependent Zn protease